MLGKFLLLLSLVLGYIVAVAFGFKSMGFVFGYDLPLWGCFLISAILHAAVISVSIESGDDE